MRLTQGFNKSIAADRPRSVGWSASVRRGSNNARSAANLVERFHQCAQRLRHVTIECRPAVECIEAYGVADAVVYADPPYLAGTRASLATRAADYSVEYHSEADHRELAAVLCASPATVFLSGYPSALYDELYGDWHRVERRLLVAASNHAGVSRHAVEVVWSNRPIACQLRLDGESGALAAGEWLAPRAGERTASGVALGRRPGAHDAAPDNPQDGGRRRTCRICDSGTHDQESMTPPARRERGGS